MDTRLRVVVGDLLQRAFKPGAGLDIIHTLADLDERGDADSGGGALVMTGEIVTGIEISVAWFAHELRIIGIKNSHSPCETAYFIPGVPAGCNRGFSNDVTVDACGLIYLLDRQHEVYDVIAPGEPSHERCIAILSR